MQELTFAANQVNNQLLTQPFQVFFILAIIYFVVCFTLTQMTHWLERRVTARRRGLPAVVAPVALAGDLPLPAGEELP